MKIGQTTTITIGPKDDCHIAIKSAYIDLISHYSPFAKKQLHDNANSSLFIAGGQEDIVRWIYLYMLGGEKDTGFYKYLDDLTFCELIDYYQHAKWLEYESLSRRFYNNLRSRLHKTLPDDTSVEKIRTVVPALYGRAMEKVIGVFINPLEFDYGTYLDLAVRNKEFGRELDTTIRKTLDQKMKACEAYHNSPAYKRHQQMSRNARRPNHRSRQRAKEKREKEQMENEQRERESKPVDTPAEEEESHHRPIVKLPVALDSKQASLSARQLNGNTNRGRYAGRERGSKRPVEDKDAAAKTNVQPPGLTTSSRDVSERKRPTQTRPFTTRPRCFHSNDADHVARNCTTISHKPNIPDNTSTVPPTPNKPSSSSPQNTTNRSKAPNHQLPICYTCKTPGHLSRICPNTAAAAESSSAIPVDRLDPPMQDRGAGRNKNRRRARADRHMDYAIDVATNGQDADSHFYFAV